MPIVGLGTWLHIYHKSYWSRHVACQSEFLSQSDFSRGFRIIKASIEDVRAAVECAIDVGYRHIDCAQMYGNEKGIGLAVEAKIKENKIKREDVFIVSKLWATHNDPKDVRSAFMESLNNLKVGYLDLYLLHFPMAFVNNGQVFPVDEEGKITVVDIDYMETWKELEKLVAEGLVKNIGISNFNEYQLTRLLKECKVRPASHQIELSPYLMQDRMIELCKKNKIAVTAYSPLGSNARPWATKEEPVLLNDPKILKIAERLGKTPAQVLIRLHVQRGIAVIPKSQKAERIKSNFQVFDFNLTEEDIKLIRSIDIVQRNIAFELASHGKYYPFRDNYTE
uniref:alcohol dehydrogenase (NADP(+)) n=1 Tax=Phallusia mammillata TaxID=59560 RepID=A0A6F9D6S7_9ASCI|nr:aldose reductase-like [Phallusia mammillata]